MSLRLHIFKIGLLSTILILNISLLRSNLDLILHALSITSSQSIGPPPL